MDEKETYVGVREKVHSVETGKGRRPTAEGDVVMRSFRQEQLACMVAHVLRTHHRRACSRLIATRFSPASQLIFTSLSECVYSIYTRAYVSVFTRIL